jgi:HEAT repeat protein
VREPVTSVAEVQTLITRATAGDHQATRRLSRVVNPDAIPLLVAVLDNPQLGIQPALGLGRIGTPEAIAALMNINPDVARRAFVVAGTEEARNVLVARGDFESLFDLGDPRGIELAAQAIAAWGPAMPSWSTRDGWPMRVAVSILGRSQERRYAELLLPLLAHTDQDVQFAAACALADLGVTDGEDRLAALADTPGFRHRTAAAAHVERYKRAREAHPA